FIRQVNAIALRRRILLLADLLQTGRHLMLIPELARLRTEAAFIAFLDAPSVAHFRELSAIELDLRRIAVEFEQR
ncbi:MAG TPA: hypothetical protein VFN42_05170, partial [Acetobacteraceae bacterium]|nr:hypothetical protein [Acetobacteraceae bacterium]